MTDLSLDGVSLSAQQAVAFLRASEANHILVQSTLTGDRWMVAREHDAFLVFDPYGLKPAHVRLQAEQALAVAQGLVCTPEAEPG